MFDVGFTELMLIGIVALVVIGPERLPAVAKTAGQWIGKLQRFVRGVKTDLASELETGDLKKLIGDQREQIDELRKMVTSAKDDFQSSTKEVVDDAKKSLSELETSVKDADEDIDKPRESVKSDGSTLGESENSAKSPVDNEKAKQNFSAQKFPAADTTPVSNPDGSGDMDRTGTESGS
ncbi:MAG: Sec-independent protein translocase protein TatB [Granulosicoccus sp.]